MANGAYPSFSDIDEEVPTTDRFIYWRALGGHLSASWRFRRSRVDLYPYLKHKSDRKYLAPFFQVFFIVVLVAVGAYAFYIVGHPPRSDRRMAIDATNTAQALAFFPSLTPTPEPTLTLVRDLPTLIPVVLLPTFAPSMTPTFDVAPYGNWNGGTLIWSSPTPTALFTPTITPTFLPAFCAACLKHVVKVRVGWFYPALGDSHCPDVSCGDYLPSTGLYWRDYLGLAAACVDTFPLFAYVDVVGVGRFQCLERLPILTCDQGVCDIAVLWTGAVANWGTVYDGVLVGQ